MTHTLPQTALAALAAAGCYVTWYNDNGTVYEDPCILDMMEFIAGKLPDSPMHVRSVGLSYDANHDWWTASAIYPHDEPAWNNRDPLLALYALALAVGAVKEGTK